MVASLPEALFGIPKRHRARLSVPRGTIPAMAYDLDLADRIRELVAGEHGVVEQQMFGGLAFLINGNMSVSASGRGGLLVRVNPDDAAALIDDVSVRPMVM